MTSAQTKKQNAEKIPY